MSESREPSPDWLREFKAPSQDFVTLSSDSDPSLDNTPKRSDCTRFEQEEEEEEEEEENDQERDSILLDSRDDNLVLKTERPKSVKKEVNTNTREDTSDAHEEEPADEDARDKPNGHTVSSRVPLVFPEKVQRTKALIECDGDSIDLSGDVGAVGRIVISNGPSDKNEMLLDLKGTIYKTTIVPSRTFCIVSIGQSEAKIEAIMNDFIQLEPHSNVFEAETMVEGTLDGFSFDSEEEGDKVPKTSPHQNDQNNENKDPTNGKTKAKIEKSLGAGNKKAKTTGKIAKKGPRKPQAVKRTRKSKK